MSGFDKSWRAYTPPVQYATGKPHPAMTRLPSQNVIDEAIQRMGKKRGKYGAVAHCVLPDLRILPADECGAVPGRIRFHSKREAERFITLRMEQEAGTISGLTLQQGFALHTTTPEGVKVHLGLWISDFTYVRDGRTVVEDSKGYARNPLYLWKKKHVAAEYSIEILET